MERQFFGNRSVIEIESHLQVGLFSSVTGRLHTYLPSLPTVPLFLSPSLTRP